MGARGLALLLLIVYCAAPASAQKTPEEAAEERAALLAFKASFSNGEEKLGTWGGNTDYCSWTGISCNPATNGYVERIGVVGLGLTGQIPSPNGWVLPSRTMVLEVGINNISGPIPAGWKLPDGLDTVFFNNNPLLSPIPAGLALPKSLRYILMQNCNLTGSIPADFSPPGVVSLNVMDNQLTGAFPEGLTRVESLQIINLDNNALTGPLPPTVTFNTSLELYGLTIKNNNFSGALPTWPEVPSAIVEILPGNPGLCMEGTMPKSPNYMKVLGPGQTSSIDALPLCPGFDGVGATDDGGGTSTGAIIGAVVGSVAGVAIALVGAAWLYRRRQQQQKLGDGAGSADYGSKLDGDIEQQKGAFSQSSGQTTSVSAPMPAFNPFMAGPSSDGGGVSFSDGTSSRDKRSSGSVRLSAAASLLRASGSGSTANVSGGSGGNAKLQAKLDALERDPPPWLISPTRLVLEQDANGRLMLLGRGSFGRVYRGWLQLPTQPQPAAAEAPAAAGTEGPSSDSSTPEEAAAAAAAAGQLPVAIKVMDVGDINAFLREAHIMQRLGSGSAHVVLLHGACVVEQQLVVVMELLEGGDLAAALANDSDGVLNWSQQGKQLALDIASGLAYLHANNVTHRDLKSKNVLLTKEQRAKVADVGGAALHSATYLSAGSSNFGGTLAWAAPELLLAAPCTQKIDVYSLGVVLFEIATHQVPVRGHVVPPAPSDDKCPAGLAQLIGECLSVDPDQRPTAQQVLDRLRAL